MKPIDDACSLVFPMVSALLENQPGQRRFNLRLLISTALTAAIVLVLSIDGRADTIWSIDTSEDQLKAIADATLTLMAFTVLPDITTSSLSISSDTTDNPPWAAVLPSARMFPSTWRAHSDTHDTIPNLSPPGARSAAGSR